MEATRRALIVRGGWEGHRPRESTDLFVPFLRGCGYEVAFADGPGVYADADRMAATDLVVQCVTMSRIEPQEVAGLRAAVAAGTGLAGWHGGIADSYRDCADYLQLVGGQFACHPGREPAARTGSEVDNFLPHRIDVLPAAAGHPITTGIDSFDLVTEQYWVLTDNLNEVLASTTLAARDWDAWHRPVTCPAVWTRTWGRGRVFVATPGHSPDVLRVPAVRTMIERGMRWASR